MKVFYYLLQLSEDLKKLKAWGSEINQSEKEECS